MPILHYIACCTFSKCIYLLPSWEAGGFLTQKAGEHPELAVFLSPFVGLLRGPESSNVLQWTGKIYGRKKYFT